MKILNIKTSDFRNIEEEKAEFCDGINIFCGKNGMGKTNLLEAIWMFTGLKSFRGVKDKELIRKNSDNSYLSAEIFSKGSVKDAEIKFRDKKTAFLMGKKLKSATELSEVFNASVFSPADLELTNEGPSIKRRFLDVTLCQLFPKYEAALKIYTRALEQRNAVIRDAKYHREIEALLYPIEKNMERACEIIIPFRVRLIEHFQSIFPEIYEKLSGTDEVVGIKYLPKCEGALGEELIKSRREDILSGNTSVGPHRDDVLLTLGGEDIRGFASQGQKRSIVLSLKLAQARIIERVKGELPVILLDDVFSELDPERQERLLEMIKDTQVFITCCDKENITSLKKGKVFVLEKGRIAECTSI